MCRIWAFRRRAWLGLDSRFSPWPTRPELPEFFLGDLQTLGTGGDAFLFSGQ